MSSYELFEIIGELSPETVDLSDNIKKQRRFVSCAAAVLSLVILTSVAVNIIQYSSEKTVGIKRDLTVQLPVVYNISEYAEIMEQGGGMYLYAFGAELSVISVNSSNVVKGKVESYEYTSYDGRALTAVNFLVEESYKGDLQSGDLVTILHEGGYIPLQDHIDRYDDRFRFENITDEEIATTVLHEVDEDTEPTVGGSYIYFIAPIVGAAADVCGEGLYGRVRGAAGLFHISADGKTVDRTYDYINFETYPIDEVIAAAKEG